VHAVAYDEVTAGSFDCVLYQHKMHYFDDRLNALSEAQRRLPRIYIEHDPPQENPFEQLHWAQDGGLLLVHVTHFNRLMWDSGITPATVIEHGVIVPLGVAYRGDLQKGIVVINNMRTRGRRLGADIYALVKERVPLDLVGMDAESAGGIGEISNMKLASFCAPYRFFFNPIRWTSLGLAIVEAMMIGMPVIGLQTTELASVIRNGDNGFLHNDVDELCDVMQLLLTDKGLARQWGEGARRCAQQRFHIDRFVADWLRVFAEVAA
jgi:glycosyltransferase involved in cell wall biosynthesis